WISIFPQHNFVFVSALTWMVLLLISYVSAKFAFRLQYGIMVIIAFSLVSAFLGRSGPTQSAIFTSGIGAVPFWQVFAIFFPAVTGILAGISMSGELKNPERNIPIGTISAIIVSFIVYVFVAVWFAHIASPEGLVKNTSIIIDVSRWRAVVIAGIMGATLSSALSMFVASPRTLLALAKHRIVPLSYSFSRINARGEPHAAILFTAFISLFVIAVGTLNGIASILTMFFLITYGMLNIALFIENSIGIVSFRPAFKVPLLVSFVGGAGCLYAMFLVNAFFSIVAISVTILIYVLLLQKNAPKDWPDVRRGIFIFIAEQAVRIASRLPYHPKIWKPNLLVPVEQPKEWIGIIDVIKAITYPRGRVEFLTVIEKKHNENADALSALRTQHLKDLAILREPLEEEGVIASSLVVNAKDFVEGADIVAQTRKGSFLPPNVLFIKLGTSSEHDMAVNELSRRIKLFDYGLMAFKFHPKLGLGQKHTINLWIRAGSPNIHLAILVALQLDKNWGANLRVLQIVPGENEKREAQEYLRKLKRTMRFPGDTELTVLVGSFEEITPQAPAADMNIFGMPQDCDVLWLKKMSDKVNSSVLFLRDSKQENAIV
ncbi:MAG: amino acid permease, partial [Candidatus Omnitrophica bacterium]|nr:amino acid permease [Candidatus Omnitrophota bacterium]